MTQATQATSRPDLIAGRIYDVDLIATSEEDYTVCAFTAIFLGWENDGTIAVFNNGVRINGWEFEVLPRP